MSSESRLPRGLPIVGYTTRRHLILDLDNTTRYGARAITKKIQWEWPKVGDCLILSSSVKPDRVRLIFNKWGRPLVVHDRRNFHLIFDNGIGYNLSCRICRVLAGLGILNPDYVRIREFRGDMTLRISPAVLYNEIKPIPSIVAWVYNDYTTRRDGYIRHYLRVKKGAEILFSGLLDSKRVADYRADDTDRGGEKRSVYP